MSPYWCHSGDYQASPDSSLSSRLSPEMSDASCITSRHESYGREDSCCVLSLRLAIWMQTKSLCLPLHESVRNNLPS